MEVAITSIILAGAEPWQHTQESSSLNISMVRILLITRHALQKCLIFLGSILLTRSWKLADFILINCLNNTDEIIVLLTRNNINFIKPQFSLFPSSWIPMEFLNFPYPHYESHYNVSYLSCLSSSFQTRSINSLKFIFFHVIIRTITSYPFISHSVGRIFLQIMRLISNKRKNRLYIEV